MLYIPSTRVKRDLCHIALARGLKGVLCYIFLAPGLNKYLCHIVLARGLKKRFVPYGPGTRVKRYLCHMALALGFGMEKTIGYWSPSNCIGICSDPKGTCCLLGINNKFENLQSEYEEAT